MIYRALRWVAGIMLHWFYSDIRLANSERIPKSGGLLIAVNHPNALVDALVTGWVIPRRITPTAKATLMQNTLVGAIFRTVGVVPLRRARDERSAVEASNRSRNTEAFREIVNVLAEGGSVVIFPEGTSHSDNKLAPLKTGLSRVALQARDSGVRNISILPVGLNFEEKGTPGSRVIVQVGEAISVDDWPASSPRELTAEISRRLEAVTTLGDFRVLEPTASAKTPWFLRAAELWGKTTHEIPIRLARAIAVAKSRSPDEPAMFTMLLGLLLVLASYVLHFAIVDLLTGSALIATLYVMSLVWGAYWTAFARHRRAN